MIADGVKDLLVFNAEFLFREDRAGRRMQKLLFRKQVTCILLCELRLLLEREFFRAIVESACDQGLVLVTAEDISKMCGQITDVESVKKPLASEILVHPYGTLVELLFRFLGNALELGILSIEGMPLDELSGRLRDHGEVA